MARQGKEVYNCVYQGKWMTHSKKCSSSQNWGDYIAFIPSVLGRLIVVGAHRGLAPSEIQNSNLHKVD